MLPLPWGPQRAVPAAGHEVQQVRLRGDEVDERHVSLLGAPGGGGEPAGLPQDHAAAQVHPRDQGSDLKCFFWLIFDPKRGEWRERAPCFVQPLVLSRPPRLVYVANTPL